MTQREAFEVWRKRPFTDEEIIGMDGEDTLACSMWMAWQACSQHYEARIKELEIERDKYLTQIAELLDEQLMREEYGNDKP